MLGVMHPFMTRPIKHLLCNRSLRTKLPKFYPVPSTEKRLNVVILGSPNAGKSVLLNSLINEKVAASSRKRNTTRSEIVGVFNHRNVQLAFHDTPGFMRKSEAVQDDAMKLRETVEESASSTDVILLVVDAVKKFGLNEQDIFAELVEMALRGAKMEIILVLNKVDLVVPKIRLLDLTKSMVSLINGVKLGPEGAAKASLDTTTFMISATDNDGVDDLKNYLLSIALKKPWLLTKDDGTTSLSYEERVEQIVFEKLLENAHEEIPYICELECKTILTPPGQDNKIRSTMRLDVDIKVDTAAQQRIVIGQHGRNLVKIRQDAVEDLEKIFPSKQVLLFLWVSLKK